MKSRYNRITDPVIAFVRERHWFVASALLALMFGLGMASMVGNSAIVDEIAHIPAGYAYLHYGDYRLNPEHPPLIKDLAALPLQFMHLKFPVNRSEWTTDVNGQWQAGWDFLYNMGNNADAILFWARLPILCLMVGFGVWLYWIARRHWGTAVALVALTFYALSPNFLGHGVLVTTDVGVSIFMFLCIVTFARFIKVPNSKNMLLLSLALAAANLAKFSGVLLYLYLGLVTLFLVWLGRKPRLWTDRLKTYTGGFIASSALSVLWIWIYYAPQVRNMPTAVQDRLITGSLPSSNVAGIAHFLVSLSHVPLMKPIVQYLLGVTMVFGRVAGGNVTYFNGHVTNQSFHGYFPELFVLKTQVALLILLVACLVFVITTNKLTPLKRLWKTMVKSFLAHTLEWTLGAFSVFYFAVSVAGNLNLGIRHILPVYLPLFALVALGSVKLWRHLTKTSWEKFSTIALAVLMAWYSLSTIMAAPNFISYFNELIGGPGNADKYFSDSGVDWGQDLKRLVMYVDQHPQITHIAVDYFGGGLPQYYMCQRQYDAQGNVLTDGSYDCSHSKFEQWHSQYGPYKGQYIAVSETFLENDRWYSEINDQPGYEYLREQKPIAKIGYSIYLYKLY